MGRPKKARTHPLPASKAAVTPAVGVQQAGAHLGTAAAAAAAPGQFMFGAHPATAGHDSEEDEETAEFRREAAELLQQRQQKQQVPAGLQQKQLDSAVKMFMSQLGVTKQVAEDALLATAEQHCRGPDEWINEAGMWLAIQSEVQDEAAKLKEAMEVSLREQQAAREAEEAAPPMALLSEERLRKKFPGSAVLARLDAVLPSCVLFSERMPLRDKVKHKLVELLRLEANCIKWWPDQGTKKYFNDTAERFCQQLGQASSSGASAAAVLPAAAGAAPGTAGRSSAGASTAAGDAPLAGQHLQNTAAPVPASGQAGGPSTALAAAAAVSAPVFAGCVGGGSCRPSPEAEAPSVPSCSTAGADGATDDDGTSAGARVSRRKRQLPARYASSSPVGSTDSRKRQQRISPDAQPSAKRQASVDCHAAAGRDSSTARRSASPPPHAVKQPAAPDTAAAGAAAAPGGPHSTQQQDRSLQAQQQPALLMALSLQQQQVPQQLPAAAGDDPLQPYLPASECLAQLLAAELQHLQHHVFNMPEKACAVPVIFQADDEQQQSDGDDSDIELVDVRQPTNSGRDILEPPESVAPPAPAAPTAGHAAAGTSAAAAAVQVPDAPQAASAAAAVVAAQLPAAAANGVPPAVSNLYLQGLAGPSGIGAAGMGDFGQQQYLQQQLRQLGAQPHMQQQAGQFGGAQQYMRQQAVQGQFMAQQYGCSDPDDFQYRASTNEQGTLVIEID